jgi:oligopeptide transport system permease protein
MAMENTDYKKRQFLSSQIDLSKFNKEDFRKATDDEKKQQDVMGESTTFFKDGMRRLRRNPLAMGSIIVLALIIIAIIVAPMICPYGYAQIITIDGRRDKGAANLAPMEFSDMEIEHMKKTGVVNDNPCVASY